MRQVTFVAIFIVCAAAVGATRSYAASCGGDWEGTSPGYWFKFELVRSGNEMEFKGIYGGASAGSFHIRGSVSPSSGMLMRRGYTNNEANQTYTGSVSADCNKIVGEFVHHANNSRAPFEFKRVRATRERRVITTRVQIGPGDYAKVSVPACNPGQSVKADLSLAIDALIKARAGDHAGAMQSVLNANTVRSRAAKLPPWIEDVVGAQVPRYASCGAVCVFVPRGATISEVKYYSDAQASGMLSDNTNFPDGTYLGYHAHWVKKGLKEDRDGASMICGVYANSSHNLTRTAEISVFIEQ